MTGMTVLLSFTTLSRRGRQQRQQGKVEGEDCYEQILGFALACISNRSIDSLLVDNIPCANVLFRKLNCD